MLQFGVDPEEAAADGTTPLQAARNNDATRELLLEWIKKKGAAKAAARKDPPKSDL